MRTRTLSREAALQYLYEVDVIGRDNAEPLANFLARQLAREEARPYSERIVLGVLERTGEIDVLISRASENWTLTRMSVVDRNVLRLGVWELVFAGDVPPKVAINEAVDLARRYSTEDAFAFVNGMLDKIRRAKGIEIPAGGPDEEEQEEEADDGTPAGGDSRDGGPGDEDDDDDGDPGGPRDGA